MNGLYHKQPTSMILVIISMFVVCLAYIGLVYSTLPFRFTFLAVAGAMALYLIYGFTVFGWLLVLYKKELRKSL